MSLIGRWRIVEMQMWGFDDDSEASGRGWAVMTDDATIEGHIFFYLGDDSSFRAVRFDAAPHAKPHLAESRRVASFRGSTR